MLFRSRGIVLLQTQRREEAIACFDRTLALKPDFIDAICSKGTALLESGRLDEALAVFDRAVAVQPNHALSWNNRGNAFVAMGRHEEALQCFETALSINPDMPVTVNNRDMALLELKRVRRIPLEAVRALFDDYAETFDAAMLSSLNKRDHIALRELAAKLLPPGSSGLRILDLGCGTGLSGEAFKDLAAGGRLDGIDIAPRMVEASRARGIYDDLIVGDLETTLAEPGPLYDLMVAADTMVYVGDLAPTFAGALNRLVPGGFYIFACEAKDGEGWEQTSANRFRHSEAYIRAEAAKTGLECSEIVPCVIREEAGAPVASWAVALRKPGS